LFRLFYRHHNESRRSHGWMGIHRGHQARPVEWLAEKFIFLVSLSAILMVLLIFLFVAREALPVFFGETNTALVQKPIPPVEMDKHSPAELQAYLELTPDQFAKMNPATLRSLMDVKIEAQDDIPRISATTPTPASTPPNGNISSSRTSGAITTSRNTSGSPSARSKNSTSSRSSSAR
jgi:hypothetical protein